MQYPNRKFQIQNAICNNIHEEKTKYENYKQSETIY